MMFICMNSPRHVIHKFCLLLPGSLELTRTVYLDYGYLLCACCEYLHGIERNGLDMVAYICCFYWNNCGMGLHSECIFVSSRPLTLTHVLQAIYSAISPGYAVTPLFGNDYYLFRSAFFWLGLPITFFIALAPRALYKAWKSSFNPGDLETFQYLQKRYPNMDFSSFSRPSRPVSDLEDLRRRRTSTAASRRNSRMSYRSIVAPLDQQQRYHRPSMDVRPSSRAASRTDMATGITSVDRGFDFATEENGVEMRRVQSRLSERRMSKQNILGHQKSLSASSKGKDAISGVLSLSRSFMRKKKS